MNNDNTIDYYLKAAWQSVANSYNQEASKFGITQATGYVLINIKKEGTTVSQLAKLLGVRSTSLSRILNNMERQSLIYREADAVDKRSVKIYLTELGIDKRVLAVQVVKDFNEYLIQNFSVRERVRLVETLQKIKSLAQQYALERK